MDRATLIGMALGFGLILATMAQGVGIGAFIDTGSVMIVIGGTLASTLIFQRLTHVLSAGKVAIQAFFDKTKPIEDLIPVIIHLAAKARKEGLVSLEGETIEDDFMARGVRLGVDGLSPEIITSTLNAELAAMKGRHERGQAIFKFMADTSPSMGLIGTYPVSVSLTSLPGGVSAQTVLVNFGPGAATLGGTGESTSQ